MEDKLKKGREAERKAKEEFYAAIEENKLREKYAARGVVRLFVLFTAFQYFPGT
jgi:hypothetical protein